MKVSASTTLLAYMAALATAAPVHEARDTESTVSTFGITAARSASPIHLQSVNANGGAYWIGASKPTSSYCPAGSSCPPGNTTLFAGGDETLSASVVVPGGQQVYIGPDGALAFTQAHSGYVPAGSVRDGFSKAPVDGQHYEILNHDGGFLACPQDGAYKVYVGVDGFAQENCIGFSAIINEVAGPGAWQYA